MSILCDVHTHTSFCDGKNTPEEMVISAIEKGCKTLGFSGHAYSAMPNADQWCMSKNGQLEYARSIREISLKYSDRIKVLLGLEMDFFSEPADFECDYTIGSVHTIKIGDNSFDVDHTPQMLADAVKWYYDGNVMAMVEDYYCLMSQIVDKTDCRIIGHFDLVTKFNEKYPLIDTASKKYQSLAIEALDALIEKHRIFEINTGAISRGWREFPYPQKFILRRLAEKKADVILTSDAHSSSNIMFEFVHAEQYARECGITNFVTF